MFSPQGSPGHRAELTSPHLGPQVTPGGPCNGDPELFHQRCPLGPTRGPCVLPWGLELLPLRSRRQFLAMVPSLSPSSPQTRVPSLSPPFPPAFQLPSIVRYLKHVYEINKGTSLFNLRPRQTGSSSPCLTELYCFYFVLFPLWSSQWTKQILFTEASSPGEEGEGPGQKKA